MSAARTSPLGPHDPVEEHPRPIPSSHAGRHRSTSSAASSTPTRLLAPTHGMTCGSPAGTLDVVVRRTGRRRSRSVRSKRHHDRPLELDHDLVALVESARPDGDDAEAGPRLRLALRQDLGLGTDRVAREDGRREADLVPAEVDARSETSATDSPVTSASVNVESTSGRSHSVVAAYSASKWIGFVFSVRSVNQTLSASSTVRPKRLR